jgi:endonuclease YncB( thermonuclease family)
MRVLCSVLSLLAGCEGIDKVEILSGDHCAPPREATIACVRDGDTVEVGECGGEAVRLLGINSPEIAHDSTEADECYGPEAAAWVTDYLLGQDVRLEFDATCTDVYDRTLAYIYLPEAAEDGSDELANEVIVREGYARVFEDFDDIALADQLYAAQADAQANNAGLWASCE